MEILFGSHPQQRKPLSMLYLPGRKQEEEDKHLVGAGSSVRVRLQLKETARHGESSYRPFAIVLLRANALREMRGMDETDNTISPCTHIRTDNMYGRCDDGRQAQEGHRDGQGRFATDLATLLYPVCVWCGRSIYRERRYDALLGKHKSVNINGLTPSTTGIFPLHRGRKTRFSFPCKGKNTHSEQ